jgi:hypothetical protein
MLSNRIPYIGNVAVLSTERLRHAGMGSRLRGNDDVFYIASIS